LITIATYLKGQIPNAGRPEVANSLRRPQKGKSIPEQNALQAVGGPPEVLKTFVAREPTKCGR
jgi:hypothetical protein